MAVPKVAIISVAILSLSAISPANAADSTLADRVFTNAESLLGTVSDVHYEHLHSPADQQVSGTVAHNDCSGFVSYLLAKHAPNQYSAISAEQPSKDYPQAKTYARFFNELTNSQPGWAKVTNIRKLKRGDFIAWAKQVVPGQKPGNSGHVAIVAEPPGDFAQVQLADKTVRFLAIKVIDSSSVDHFSPDLLPPNAGQKHRDGLGKGYVRIVVDNDNDPIGYWEGTYWNEGDKPINGPSYTPVIGFARLVSTQN
ncbi:MAG TPA: hypothetical protein V6C89_06480 [Drouetiella sp.]|jgi:cell wall-associated NlpC family hydrolase